jgi:hypothetical protein
MKFNPSSVELAPRTLPIWPQLLDDLGNPPSTRIARVLGVGVRTVRRWNRAQRAPRVACLALFWLTRWGRSQVDAQVVNDCMVAVSYATGLETEVRALRTQLARILALGEFGAANDPALIPPAPRPLSADILGSRSTQGGKSPATVDRAWSSHRARTAKR